MIWTCLHTFAVVLGVSASREHIGAGTDLVHLPLVCFRLFDVLGRIDEDHVALSSGRRLLLSIDCIIFRIHERIMILRGILSEELLVTSDVRVTLSKSTSKTSQVLIVPLLHAEWLMSTHFTRLLQRILIGYVNTVSGLTQATDNLVDILRFGGRDINHAVDASWLQSIVALVTLKIVSPAH